MTTPPRERVRHGEGGVAQLRVELAGVSPPVWRRLLVSTRATLLELHAVLQHAFGQHEALGHQFLVDGIRYPDPSAGEDSAFATDQNDLRSLGLPLGARFEHVAETGGEPWRHVLTLEQRTPRLVGQRLPWCLEGRGAAPPEDCDGPTRYLALLAALSAPLDARTAELREWLPADFDPEFVDLTTINAELGRLPKLRLES